MPIDAECSIIVDRDEILRLRADDESDFPWFCGSFERTPAFSRYAELFQPLVDGSADELHFRVDLLASRNLSNSDVFVDFGDGDPDYLHALVLRRDARASWRIGTIPLPSDDEL